MTYPATAPRGIISSLFSLKPESLLDGFERHVHRSKLFNIRFPQ
jgi:hypothetical protein